MRKSLTIVFGIIFAVTVGLAITALASTEAAKLTVITFVPCEDPTKATYEDEQYHVKKGGEVIFVNESRVPIRLSFENCNLFEGDPAYIELLSGGAAQLYHVKEEAEQCSTDLVPSCAEARKDGRAGPIIIPENGDRH
jgi:hypothetical protein